MATSEFNPTADQERALERMLQWFGSSGSPERPWLSLGGYAGTGKTTLLGKFRLLLKEKHPELPELKVSFCAFTGKASQVLAGKLREQNALGSDDTVSTIHGLIYEAQIDEQGRLIEWKKRKKLNSRLIVVDEASMVTRGLWSDLLSFGIPVLAVGDHGQLPPVNDDFSLMSDPDLRLEQIHRQAQDSPIIQLSMRVRETGRIPFGSFGSGVAKIRSSELDLEELLSGWNVDRATLARKDALFLTGRNTTRVALNRRIRTVQGVESEEPVSGDRVICLRNNWVRHIFNGQLGTLTRIAPGPMGDNGDSPCYRAEVEMDDGSEFSGLISRAQFNQPTTQRFTGPGGAAVEGDLFDFGYALTVHKAQGSQAKRVVVFEERILREDELWRRWLYTAITRAETELLVVS